MQSDVCSERFQDFLPGTHCNTPFHIMSQYKLTQKMRKNSLCYMHAL